MSDLKIYWPDECEQGSDAWKLARLAIPTASKFSDVLAKGQGITRTKYLYQLAGEALTGEAHEGYSNHHMERGTAQEPDARREYAWKKGVDLVPVGFMRRGNAGASPDSLIGEDGLLEVKTRLPHLQVEVLLANGPPSANLTQVYGQLLISGRAYCDLISYCPGLPLAIWRIEADTVFQARLSAELDQFNTELNALVERIRGMM